MPWDSSVLPPELLARLDALQLRYIDALDRQDLNGWAACFASSCSYICMSHENEDQNLKLAIMMDDSRARINDRITYVTKIWAETFEDYKTRHFVQRIKCGQGEAGVLWMQSNFMVAYTSPRGRSELLVAGDYHDEIVMESAEAKFRSKKVVLDGEVTPRYLVYPV